MFLLLGGLIVTGYTGVEFDRSRQTFREFNSFLFMRSGKWKTYDNLEKIFINAVKTSQYIYTQVTTGSTIRTREFDAYLKTNSGIKVFLTSRKDKEVLKKDLEPLAEFLRVPVVDNTVNPG